MHKDQSEESDEEDEESDYEEENLEEEEVSEMLPTAIVQFELYTMHAHRNNLKNLGGP